MVKLILTINGEELDYDIIKEEATLGEQVCLLPFDSEIKKLIKEMEREDEDWAKTRDIRFYK